jgi:creatinine amidohydrolase/Fe(II)-dependent formamide hydrolase-like protein
VLVELGRDAARHWDALLLVNGHGGNRDAVSEAVARLRGEGVRPVSPNGILGDPRGATAAEGDRLLGELIAGCTAALDALLTEVPAYA